MELPGTEMLYIHSYGVRLLRASRKERALKIFLFNQQRHPEEKFWTHFGLARAYAALGDKPNAIFRRSCRVARQPLLIASNLRSSSVLQI